MLKVAACRCGDLRAECSAAPVRVSVCHCVECQRRTGSAFSTQARFAAQHVQVIGEFRTFIRKADGGNQVSYKCCGNCGSTIAYAIDAWPDVIAVPLGAFADAQFPEPAYSIFERQKHSWVSIAGEVTEHFD